MALIKRYISITLFSCICTILTQHFSILPPPEDYTSNDPINTLSPCHPDPRLNATYWFPDFSTRLLAMKERPPCPRCIHEWDTMELACSRWWHPTPHRLYEDDPPRAWNGVLRPSNQQVRPCGFGQSQRPPTQCSPLLQQLFGTLDRLRLVYFPNSGTELGIVRGSGYLSQDGDIDIYVDMPAGMLYQKLREALKEVDLEKSFVQRIVSLVEPALHMSGEGVWTEVHFKVWGCPEVHMVYNDWMSSQLQHFPAPADLCSCRMNSVELLCHKDGVKRMYAQYGPSWRVPLGVKGLDKPYWAFTHTRHPWTIELTRKLRSMVSEETGFIEEDAVRSILEEDDVKQTKLRSVVSEVNGFIEEDTVSSSLEGDDVTSLILAQLNVVDINLPNLPESTFWGRISSFGILFIFFTVFGVFLTKITFLLKYMKLYVIKYVP